MSIDISWDKLTTGPDGIALAEKIRNFVHDKFQSAPLPRFIKSVKVNTFDFGSISPEVEIKDICNPFPDFYEEICSDNSDSDSERLEEEEIYRRENRQRNLLQQERKTERDVSAIHGPRFIETRPTGLNLMNSPGEMSNHLSASTPGIPGGTSNLNYFHTQLANGLSGTRTPLAAVAGAHMYNGWPEYSNIPQRGTGYHSRSDRSTSPPSISAPSLREKTSVLTLLTTANDTRPHTRDGLTAEEPSDQEPSSPSPQPRFHKTRIEDVQTVFRVRYSGDVKLSLTAEILLDYPMPSFVGIPVQLKITGLTFDGVAVLASIRKRVHFCFLSPEDALIATANESSEEMYSNGQRIGSLLQEIKVESEIGKRESGKQLLKNVGKVEKFVLDQVRRIFEDELVFPSFWTFLI